MAIDTPMPRNILIMIGESEVALMVKIFGSSYSQGMVELDNIIIKNKNLFERMVLTRFLSQIRLLHLFVHPTFFCSTIKSTTNIKEKIVWGIPLRSPSQCKLCFLNFLIFFFTMVLL